MFRYAAVPATLALAIFAAACSSDSDPSSPTQPAVTLTAPAITTPGANQQLDTLRPTLTVKNVTS